MDLCGDETVRHQSFVLQMLLSNLIRNHFFPLVIKHCQMHSKMINIKKKVSLVRRPVEKANETRRATDHSSRKQKPCFPMMDGFPFIFLFSERSRRDEM